MILKSNLSNAIMHLEDFLNAQQSACHDLAKQFPNEDIDLYQDHMEDLFKNLRVLMYYKITPDKLDNLLKINKAYPDLKLLDEVNLGLESFQKIAKNIETLLYKHGQLKSFQLGESVDDFERPIPWITYPALEFLTQFDFSNLDIYEFGSGNSTLFWADICKTVSSVETEKEWYEKTLRLKPSNVKLTYFDNMVDFSESILKENQFFDVIYIDSIRYRYEVVLRSIKKLKDGGIIIFDNADWYPNSVKLLRDEEFLEIDFHGFGPINGYTWTTSIFFREGIKIKRLNKKILPVGGIDVILKDDGPILSQRP